ncbi:hypothetical protein [Candidatus Manganitrophus noduliformans]|uniref:Uncharacterized protein n=1 Tax=Candidatus Manganitrophus noduliformans TaxID=2606439 RepID=A0A7X6DT42_9BACT|nr:hypothetical protein [Candidatus Manganitrophus noduliformans]NKE72897.1 hypothetical protein [Candidatus Manganitrophus noduliformans]
MMSAVSLAPLQKKKPYLPPPPYYYPTPTKFKATLTKLKENLRSKLLARFPPPEKKSRPYHDTERTLLTSMDNMEAMITTYLEVKPVEPVLVGMTIFPTLSGSVGRRKPTFKSSAVGDFYVQVAPLVQRVETDLAPEAFPVDDWQQFLPKFEEHMAWVKIVRLCIVITMVNALDYKSIWGKKDGDAGWSLSERAKDCAAFILKLEAYNEISIHLLNEDTFLEDLGLRNSVQTYIQAIESLIREVNIWQNWCKLKVCSVGELGETYPWEFKPIPRDLFSAGDLVSAPFPVEMYARDGAIIKAAKVKKLWDNLIERGVVSNDFQFCITAGTLKHGGAHPPHIEHRNGSMFDFDLKNLPNLVGREGPATLVVTMGQHVEEEPIGVVLELEYSLGDRLFDWDFPPHKRYEEFYNVAKKFTKCIYLTFPTSVLYASEKITVQAKKELLIRIDELLATTIDKANIADLSAIREAIKKINPTPWKGKPKEKQDKMRLQHRHHWHVNYSPDTFGE